MGNAEDQDLEPRSILRYGAPMKGTASGGTGARLPPEAWGGSPAIVAYAAGFDVPVYPSPQSPQSYAITYVAEDITVMDEAKLVAEVLRRVLAGRLSPKSRELLSCALDRCEDASAPRYINGG